MKKTLFSTVLVLCIFSPGLATAATDVSLNPDGVWLTYDETVGVGNNFSETWVATANETVQITDLYVLGDMYNIYLNGGLVASPTSLDWTATGNGATGSPFTTDPQTAWMTTGQYAFSHALFAVNAGDNITIESTYIPSGYTDSTVAISAVPEPETYGMMLGGLGLLGFIAGRRKSV